MSRSPRPGPDAGGVGARGGVLLALAVVVGVVLLQAFDTDGGSSPVASGNTTPVNETTSTLGFVDTTTSTIALRPPNAVKVLAVNASGRDGVANLVKEALLARDYDTLSAVKATSTISVTRIQFAPGFEGEARVIAQLLMPPVAIVEPLNSPPVKEADIRDAKVLVLLGSDVPVATTTTTVRAATATTKKATTSTTRGSTTTKASSTSSTTR